VASFKGGVAKTTTAVHLAACLNEEAKTLLIDGDPNRSASGWAKRGNLPFTVIDERLAAKQARHFEHIVIDTQARPEQEDLEALADGCDLLIIPSTPDALALDALMLTVDVLNRIGSEHYKVLLTIIPPKPSRDGDEARHMLTQAGLPLFKASIRRLVAFQKAALAGVPVSGVNDKRAAQGWADYQAVARELWV
jgi:chromosome partitioning protein